MSLYSIDSSVIDGKHQGQIQELKKRRASPNYFKEGEKHSFREREWLARL